MSHSTTPWHVQRMSDTRFWVSNGHRTVASTFTLAYSTEEHQVREAEANARLIAASPDLLHAARAALSQHKDAATLLKMSVAKAEGA